MPVGQLKVSIWTQLVESARSYFLYNNHLLFLFISFSIFSIDLIILSDLQSPPFFYESFCRGFILGSRFHAKKLEDFHWHFLMKIWRVFNRLSWRKIGGFSTPGSFPATTPNSPQTPSCNSRWLDRREIEIAHKKEDNWKVEILNRRGGGETVSYLEGGEWGGGSQVVQAARS